MKHFLFHYRRRIIVKTDSGDEERLNDNYVNPFNVVSAFWELNKENVYVLNIFLTNNYNLRFGEALGKKFLEHMEIWGFAMCGRVTSAPSSDQPNRRNERGERPSPRPFDTVEVEESATEQSWS